MPLPSVTVIIATYNRHAQLAVTLNSVRSQMMFGNSEVIVVSDGHDPVAQAMAQHWKAVYAHTPERCDDWGASCNDLGIRLAHGDYLVFWNDDNLYLPEALMVSVLAATGADIGVVQCGHWVDRVRRVIPESWSGEFTYGNVDTMCFCVLRSVAARSQWRAEGSQRDYACDLNWIRALHDSNPKPRIRFIPHIIGEHL